MHKYDYFRDLKNIETSPIVGIHLWYEGKIDSPDALALLDRETDWIFNKNKNFQINKTDSTYLSLVISGSRMVTDMSKEDILEMALAEVNTVLPQTRSARLLKSYVLKERKATFSALPGIEKLRPSQESPLANVAIAGEWTDTGWPSTMESAARSGFLAAEVILSKCGIKTRLTAPDMPMNGLARFITRV